MNGGSVRRTGFGQAGIAHRLSYRALNGLILNMVTASDIFTGIVAELGCGKQVLPTSTRALHSGIFAPSHK